MVYPNPTPRIQKITCIPMFTAAQLTIVKTRKQPKCPLTDEWVKKRWYISTVKHDWAIKKNKIMPSAATWMDLEIIILSEQSQKTTNKYLTLTCSVQFSSVAWSYPTLWPHRRQLTRPPSPLPTPGVYSNSCSLSQWCHPAISSSVVPFSSCLQSFPA